MRWFVLSLLLLSLGCAAKEEPLPPVPPAPEDLSTWSVPELVQPPTPETPLHAPSAQEKATPAEQILDFAPGTTFRLTVSVGAPLDLVLQRGEQVRNIIGGDRAPVEPNQTTRWEIKEGGEGVGETFRQHRALLPSSCDVVCVARRGAVGVPCTPYTEQFLMLLQRCQRLKQ